MTTLLFLSIPSFFISFFTFSFIYFINKNLQELKDSLINKEKHNEKNCISSECNNVVHPVFSVGKPIYLNYTDAILTTIRSIPPHKTITSKEICEIVEKAKLEGRIKKKYGLKSSKKYIRDYIYHIQNIDPNVKKVGRGLWAYHKER